MIKLNKNIGLSIIIIGLMVFSVIFVAVPTEVKAVSYISASAKCTNNPVWANGKAVLYLVVSNSGDTGANVNVKLDYDETYMTIFSAKATAMCVEYNGIDDGDVIKWNNVYVPPVGNPSGGPVDSCTCQMFSATVNALISKCAPNGLEIKNELYFEKNGHWTGPKKAKIQVINSQFCGFNLDYKVKSTGDESSEWYDEMYADIGDTLKIKTQMTNSGNKVYVSSIRDLLPSGLRYVSGSAKVNQVSKEASIKTLFDGTVKLGFGFKDEVSRIQKIGLIHNGETLTLTFNVNVVEHGDFYSEVTASTSATSYWNDIVPISDTILIHSTDSPPQEPEPDPEQDPEPDLDPDPIEGSGEPIVQVIKPELGVLYINEREIPTQLKKIFAIGPITISANAIDLDGDITKVEFKVNNDIKQTYSEPPYDFVYDEKGFGFKKISIKAYDNDGAASEETINLFIINFGNR